VQLGIDIRWRRFLHLRVSWSQICRGSRCYLRFVRLISILQIIIIRR